MRRPILVVTAALLIGCTQNSGVTTTPTFQAARPVPVIPVGQLSGINAGPTRAARPMSGQYGLAAVASANRSATVEPSAASMQGATWVIDQHDPSRIYRVALAPKRATTILLPPGEQFNSAIGGNVEGFVISIAYAGPRPAVSILPRAAGMRGNLQLATTGGFYSFDLRVTPGTALNLVDVGRAQDQRGTGQLEQTPQPQGDFTRLSFKAPKGPLPAWAPAEAWADSYKMVIRFNGPLPILPALFAGQKGEQMVSYRTVISNGCPILVTSRRVTEAELRLDQEVIRFTVDNGQPVDSAKAPEDWNQAAALPEPTVAPTINLVVLPGSGDGVIPTSVLSAEDLFGTGLREGEDPLVDRQPMAPRLLGAES